MKHITITLLLLLFALPFFAQTGAWGLSYDMQLAGAIEHIKSQGFTVIGEAENYYFKRTQSPVSTVRLYPNPDDKRVLAAWELELPYEDESGESLEYDFLYDLFQMHDDPDFEDYESFDFSWDLGENRFLDYFYDYWSDQLIMYYGDNRYPDFDN